MVATSSKLKDPPPDMSVPPEIEIRPSHVDAERMGLWCKKAIKKGSRFGPFVGDKALEVDDRMDPSFIWEIVDVETKEFLFYINATDPRRGNWMRYINCARYFEEQNIVSEQDGIDIYFEAIKDIEPGKELLTWYEKSPIRKKKGKKRAINHVRRAKKTVSRIITEVSGSTTSSVSQRGRRRSAKKYWKIEENADPRDAAEAAGESADWDVNDDIKEHVVSEVAENDDSTCGKMGLNGYFEFELLPIHTAKNRLGRKMFQCDVCSGVYRHCFSLKRHYLRNHINRRYISRVDALNCNITFFEPEEEEKSAAVNNGAKTDKRDDERGPVEPQDSSPRVKAASGRNDKNSEKEGKEKEEEEVVTTLQLDVEEIGSNDVTESTAKAVRGRKSSAAGAMHLPGLFRCYVCEKLFDKVGSLKSHFSENHASGADKRFACRHCQMQFKHRQNLVRHEVVHSGAKPYVCDHCNKRFPTLTNRRRHERIHRGTRLACPLCSSSFTQTNDLKKHVRRQHPESYRACAYCSRYFTADSQLSVHLRRVHPGTDLDANRRRASVQRDARSAALEADRAESRRIAANGNAAAAAAGGGASADSAADPASTNQFACTVCCKSFTDYANMCRHRRLAHGCGVLGADPDESSSDDDEVSGVNGGRTTDSTSALTVLDIQQSYFAGVARNIANNLDYHIEGKSDHLARATSHIKWRQPSYTAAFNAVVTAENNSSPAVSLEQFNFPRGFTMKPMCDLYEERVAAETGDESASAQKDSSPIQVPDVRMCHVCKAVFHSTAELEEHVLQSHDSNASESSGADAEPPTLVAEQPLDLRSPVMNSIQSADDATGALVIPLDKDSTECTDLHSTAVFDKTTQPADVERKLMCLVCFGEFEDTDTLIQHQSDRHANIDCRHIEVDKNYFPAVSGVQPKVVGLLNVRSSQLPATLDYHVGDVTSVDEVMCTKCQRMFPSRSALHSHIVECGDYWRNLSDRLTWVFVLRGSQIPVPPPASLSSTSSSAKNKQQKRRGKYRWGTISTSGDALRRRLQRMLIRQHVGIPVGQDELGALPAIKAASGVVGGAMASRRASARISSRRSSDSPPPPALPPPPPPPQGPSISADATVNQRNAVETRKRPAVAATGQNTRRHCRRRGAAVQSADVGEAAPVDMTKCDRCSAAFQTAEEMAAHVAAKCCADCSRDDAAAVPGQGPDGQGDVVDDPEEDVFDPTKHLCIYCTRQFTFVRALRRHVIETCAVRRELVENGEYIDEEWETQLTAMAGVGPVGGKQLTPGGTTDTGNDESIGNDGGRGGKRRRRCMNWTSSKSRSRRSARSSDDADDSLFGWEDAFLSTWGKDEREDITKREPLDTNATVSSTSFGAVKEERLPDQADGQSEPLQQLTSDIKLNMSSGDNTETLTSKAPVASEGAMTSDKAGSVQQATSGNLSSGMKQMTSDELDEGKENVKDPSLAVTSTPVSSERPTTTKNLDVSMSSDQDVTTLSSSAVDSDVTSAANSSVTSAGVDDSQADPDNDLEAAEESTEFVQKKSRKRRGHRLTVAKRKKN